MILPATPAQTVGPFYSIGLRWPASEHVFPPDTPGAIRLRGTVFDGRGEPIPDHAIETWQADPEGRFVDLHAAPHAGPPSTLAGFRGFGRCCHEVGDGSFELVTVKPGRVRGPGGRPQAPHIDVSLFARGLLHRLVTRVYFADEEEANASDPVLRSVPSERRSTLLAVPEDGGYRFDIHLQGPRETVFFAL